MKIISTIEFKSTEYNYRKEVSGEKNNTVRHLLPSERIELTNNYVNIKYIRIRCTDGIQMFVRELTDITMIEIGGIQMCIFSW